MGVGGEQAHLVDTRLRPRPQLALGSERKAYSTLNVSTFENLFITIFERRNIVRDADGSLSRGIALQFHFGLG